MKNFTWLTLLVGLPRSGKSTWINARAGDTELVVSNDWIRENILGGSYASSANPVVWTLVDATLRIALSQGISVILDGVGLTKATRKFYTDIARQYEANVKIVVVDTPLASCLERNRTTAHKLPEEKLIEMSKQFELPTADEYDEVEFYHGYEV